MNNNENRRYPGARPFEADEAKLFFGRSADSEKLYQQLLNEKTVLLYGKSGLGKSSLINAGVLPLLIQTTGYETVQVRFGNYNAQLNQYQKPLEALITQIKSSVNPASVYLDKIIPNENSLWYRFKQRQFPGTESNILFIFDQFEELLSYPEEHIFHFKKQFAHLLFAGIPTNIRNVLDRKLEQNPRLMSKEELQLLQIPLRTKALFAIRSDRMSELNRITDYFPNILKTFYELNPLNRQQAETAIVEPAKKQGKYISPAFYFDPLLVKKIITELEDKETRAIESFQLQIVCRHVEDMVINKGLTQITLTDVDNVKEIFENHYRNIINNLAPEKQNAARRLIEERLIIDGSRIPMPIPLLLKDEGMTRELLDELIGTHLLRPEQNNTVEISHDTLIEPILKERASGFLRLKQQADLFYTQAKYKEAIEQYSKYLETTANPNATVLEVYKKRADSYAKVKKLEESIKDYESILNLDDKDTMAVYNIAVNYADLDQHEKAEVYFDKSVAINPDYAADTYNEVGNDYYNRKKHHEWARHYYEKAILANPDFYYAYYNIGLVEADQGNTKAALDLYDRSLSFNPNEILALTAKASLLIQLQRADEAIYYLEKIIENNPETTDPYQQLGHIYAGKGQDKEAKNYYKKAIKYNPKDYLALYNLGFTEYRLGHSKAALTYFKKVLELKDDFADVYNGFGNIYFDEQKYLLAEENYARALSLDPKYEFAYYNLGSIAFLENNLEESLKNYKKVLEINPDNIEAHERAGTILEKMTRYDDALVHLARAVRPDSTADRINQLGNVYFSLKRYDEAKERYKQALEKDPQHYSAYSNLALVESTLGNMELALEWYKKALEANPDHIASHQAIADVLAGQKFWEEAISHLIKVTKLAPKSADAFNQLGNVYMDIEEYEKAKDSYEHALKLDSKFYLALFNLSLIHYAKKDIGSAIADCQKAITIERDYYPSHILLGDLLTELKKYKEAISEYSIAREISDQPAEAFARLGGVYFNTQDWDKANEYYERALQHDATFYDACVGLGMVAYNMGDLEKALTYYERAITINPKSERAYYEIGNIKIDQENYDEALGYLETAIKLNPNFSGAYINLSHSYLKLNPFKKAEEMSRKAIEREPLTPDIYLAYINMAEAQAELGKYTDALENCSKANELKPASDEVNSAFGLVHEKMGEMKKAQEYYEKSLALNPEYKEAKQRLTALKAKL